ncbi:MAG: radical SAM family heme chaperone HemW [Paracoccaceae bacterium]
MPEDWRAGGFGLYIHWPFCKAKCPYCDFNSHISANIDQNRWNRAYLSEIQRTGNETQGRILDTVYFGGGTPSLMSPELVNSVLGEVRKTWPTSNSFEVTLEANPTSVEAGHFRGYRDAGVNRLSMGFQAINDADLKALGRLHTVKEGQAAFDLARGIFERISFDLIYARQNQSLANWQQELKQALTLSADHLSLYQLTVEDGTAFGDRLARGILPGLPDDDNAADMYFATQELCEQAGMPAYEVSNHASDGAQSLHNLIYWRGGDYVGIGPGAHGRLTLAGARYATETPLAPTGWLGQVESTGSGDSLRQVLSGPEQAGEYLMMGLRLTDGISIKRYERFLNAKIDPDKLSHLIDLEMVTLMNDTLAATPKGRPILNAIIRELLP